MESLNVSLLYLSNAPMPHDKAFQKAQKKKYQLALEAFDSAAAVDCSWEVGDYKKVHGGGTSTMQGYCIGTMRGRDGITMPLDLIASGHNLLRLLA